MMIRKFPSGPLDTNTILLGCGKAKQAAVIDPAYGSTASVLEEASSLELRIGMILLTHSHWDHIADVHVLKGKTGASVYVHPLDAKNLEHPGSDGVPTLFPIRGVHPDGFLQDGQELKVGHITLKVIHTPGHSPGGVCFYIPEHHVLISGDTLFQGTIGSLGLPTSHADSMWQSLKKISGLPPETVVIPGHGPDTTLKDESWMHRAQEIFKDSV